MRPFADDDGPIDTSAPVAVRHRWAVAAAALVVPAIAVGALTMPALVGSSERSTTQAPAFAHLAAYAAPAWAAEPRPERSGAPAVAAAPKPAPKPAAKPATPARAAAAAPRAQRATARAAIRVQSGRPVAAPTQRKTTSPAPKPPTPAPAPSSSIASQVLAYTNQARARAGCSALSLSSTLSRAAQGHAADMAGHDYFSHTSRDGRSFGTRIRNAGWTRTAGLAENIAAGQTSPAVVVKAWMDSPGHRANLLNCAYRYLGVGYATGGTYNKYWVQDFGG